MYLLPTYFFEFEKGRVYLHVTIRNAEGEAVTDTAVVGMGGKTGFNTNRPAVENLVRAVAELLMPGVHFTEIRHIVDGSVH